MNYTFLRLRKLGRIAYSADDSRACFNTGLQTPNEKDIFATFFRYKLAAEKDQPAWTLFGILDSYSDRLSDFRPLPGIAGYVEDPADLVFDTSYEFEVNFDHIFDQSRDRLPEILRDSRTLAYLRFKVLSNWQNRKSSVITRSQSRIGTRVECSCCCR